MGQTIQSQLTLKTEESMHFPDTIALLIANISTGDTGFKPKSIFTPYVKVTHLRLLNKVTPSEGQSFFYKSIRSSAVLSSNIQTLESKAMELTALALKKLDSGFPVKNTLGIANIIKLSKGEYIIVAVIAEDHDCIDCANYVSTQISKMK